MDPLLVLGEGTFLQLGQWRRLAGLGVLGTPEDRLGRPSYQASASTQSTLHPTQLMAATQPGHHAPGTTSSLMASSGLLGQPEVSSTLPWPLLATGAQFGPLFGFLLVRKVNLSHKPVKEESH